MKIMRFLMTMLVFFGGTGIALAIPVSGSIINPANGHSYFLLEQDNWTNSEAEAITLGGHLATINDAAENDWVYDTFSFFGAVKRDLWIGFNDAASEGDFVWASGELIPFTNFGTGEPNDGAPLSPPTSEDFVFILAQPFPPINAREWNDAPDVVAGIYGVVEVVAPAPVPEPSTMILLGTGLIGLIGASYRHRKTDGKTAA
jgi:hypothetical protein